MRLHTPCFWYLACSLIFALLLSGVSANACTEAQSLEEPLLVIWQDSEAPSGGPWPAFPTGLIGAVWSDGRIIRTEKKTKIGRTYIEGYIGKKEIDDFRRSITSTEILARPDEFSVAVDGPSRTITIRAGNKKHSWTRDITDGRSTFNDIENRMWRLPLEQIHSVDNKNANLDRFRP